MESPGALISEYSVDRSSRVVILGEKSPEGMMGSLHAKPVLTALGLALFALALTSTESRSSTPAVPVGTQDTQTVETQGSLTPNQAGELFAYLGINARSVNFETSGDKPVRFIVTEYLDGKEVSSEDIGSYVLPGGKHKPLVVIDERDSGGWMFKIRLGEPRGASVERSCRLAREKGVSTSMWIDKHALKPGQPCPLWFVYQDPGKKDFSWQGSIEAVIRDFKKVIVVSLEVKG
jgi:hypothetical protein